MVLDSCETVHSYLSFYIGMLVNGLNLLLLCVPAQMGSAAAELEERARGGQLWAQQLLQLSEQLGGVRLVLTPERGRTVSCLLRPAGRSPPPVRTSEYDLIVCQISLRPLIRPRQTS